MPFEYAMNHAIHRIHQPPRLDAVPEHNATHDQEHDRSCKLFKIILTTSMLAKMTSTDDDHKGNSVAPQSEAAVRGWDDDTNLFLSDEDTPASHIGGVHCATALLCQYLTPDRAALPSYMTKQQKGRAP